ncbi:MAG: Asp-tRNA(Asn)/Glu-tRNA(Gln) amidotransferase subunit GatA [Candidatus Beckwithbacteria bacterium]|nr:Asp-tRNA(Asn)/Glu-tRNA(Gln) amidotransferase subunit GatA [Patescibacteria group bacterium]
MKLNQLTIASALTGLKNKSFSSLDLTKACLNQIEKTNKNLNTFLTLNPSALTEAKRADNLIKTFLTNFEKYPLLGIPYALKDNFLTKGLRTTASAKVLDNYIPQYSSTVYKRLKNAGAILLGKTNMDAWAHGSSTENSDYGPTKNPWNQNHLPGGSSGGSAAAVIADQCIFAIGSETAGSIRQPAAWSGVTGFKPTYGRVSRYGVIAMASSTDSPGPLTKNVIDAFLVTKVIAGHDPKDATTSSLKVNLTSPKTKSLKGFKIALPKEYLIKEMDSQTTNIIKKAVNDLKKLGAKVETISLLDPHFAISVYTIIQRSEVSSNLGRYDGVRYGHPRTYFSHEAKNRVMLGTYTLSTGYYDQYYNHSQKVRTIMINEFNKTFKDFDLIIGPVSPGPALKVGSTQKNPSFGEMQDILVEASSLSGLTGLSVPCGFVNGLPIGLQITGDQFAEQLVLNAGHAYQQAIDHHLKRPTI